MSFSQQDLLIWSQDIALNCAGNLKSRPGSGVSGEVIKGWSSELNNNRTSHNNRGYSLCTYVPSTVLVTINISLFNPRINLSLSVLLTTAWHLASHIEEGSSICIQHGDAGDRGCRVGWEDAGPAVCHGHLAPSTSGLIAFKTRLPISCVTSGKSFNLPEPQFSHLLMGPAWGSLFLAWLKFKWKLKARKHFVCGPCVGDWPKNIFLKITAETSSPKMQYRSHTSE